MASASVPPHDVKRSVTGKEKLASTETPNTPRGSTRASSARDRVQRDEEHDDQEHAQRQHHPSLVRLLTRRQCIMTLNMLFECARVLVAIFFTKSSPMIAWATHGPMGHPRQVRSCTMRTWTSGPSASETR